jgi:hypothetical protein
VSVVMEAENLQSASLNQRAKQPIDCSAHSIVALIVSLTRLLAKELLKHNPQMCQPCLRFSKELVSGTVYGTMLNFFPFV